MNISTFLNHYQIRENPFSAEEARHDSIFNRIETACHHPDFEKIKGNFERPSSSIVFGERGTGKTAIRLQIEDELERHNKSHVDTRCLPVMYDELNPVLDRFNRSVSGGAGRLDMLETLQRFRLVDHIDAMMNVVVPHIVDEALGDSGGRSYVGMGESPGKALRRLDSSAKRDLLALQLCYDRPEAAAARTHRLKRVLRWWGGNAVNLYRWLAAAAAVVLLVVVGFFLFRSPQQHLWLWYATIILLALFTLIMAGRFGWLWWKNHRLARELSRQLRTLDRPVASLRKSLATVKLDETFLAALPRNDDDDLRYAMFARVLNVVRPFGFRSMLVLVDRVDEPTMINGEPQRMKAIVWPLLNNKFLQQDRVGVKLLLPLELRYQLNRETPEFFREARLDKQNLIERLTWSGATLYDLCSARLNACRPPDAGTPAFRAGSVDSAGAEFGSAGSGGGMSLRDMFDENVTTQDLIDALDQMQQPRDAFKFIYQLISEHCANVPEENPQFTIPRPVLDGIRKQQVERMSGMLRGVRPA